MARPLYRVISLDLAVARAAAPIPGVDVGVKFDGVTVLQIPGGNTVGLSFGNGDFIPILQAGPFRFLDGCEHPFFCDEGLFLQNAAGAGTLVLLVSFGTSPNVQEV